MSWSQMIADERRLLGNNAAVRRLARAIPGSVITTIGSDWDTGTEVKSLAIGTLSVKFDYANEDREDHFWITIFDAAKYVGSKHCRNYNHLLNTLKKVVAMEAGELRVYLAQDKSYGSFASILPAT